MILPPFDRVVYPPSHEPARRVLTGLPTPSRTPDGWDRCGYCGGRVRVLSIVTHVEGSTPVRVIEDHICRQPVA